MMFRTYGRRGRGLGRSCSSSGFSDGVSGSSSQEFSQDVYDFSFPPDPYDFDPSQDSGRSAALLPPRKDGDDFRNSKKLKVIGAGSRASGENSLQESKKFGILRISGKRGSQRSRVIKKVNTDPFDYDLSQEVDDLGVPPRRKGGEDSVFEFSEDGDLWGSRKSKNVDNGSCGFNSSQELSDLGVSQSRNPESQGDGWDLGGDFGKSRKRDGVEVNPDPYDYNSSQELEEHVVPPQSKVRDDKVFDFSEDGDLWESKKSKNLDLDSFTLDSSQELGNLGTSKLRKHESNGDHLGFGGVSGKSKKKNMDKNGKLQRKKNKKKMKSKESEPRYVELTATLMETQESGEMMEHEDEVNFALDGLKKGQPVAVHRASLLSLLTICGTAQQRRLLKVHGMAEIILDAVLGLNFDDMPSNVAAAALVYVLTVDGQNDYLLDSPSCIHFLIKMLKPLSPSVVKEKALPVGSKLVSLCRSVGLLQEPAKGTDSSSTAIMLQVREILVDCKEMKSRDDSHGGVEEPELNPKWISLLTMEKACSCRISIEDTTGIRKTGGKFKEKLRVFGGLDSVFEVARKCHSVLEEWSEKSPTFALDSREISGLESLVLLLKCLKIMENALFLSNDNQRHLLEMKGSFDGQRAPRSFTKLVLSVIKILSGVLLLRNSSPSDSQDEDNHFEGLSGLGLTSQESFTQLDGIRSSAGPTQSSAEALLLKLRAESSQAGMCSGTSRESDKMVRTSGNSGMDGQDPFMFDEDDCEPSKWDVMSGSSNKPLSQDSRHIGNRFGLENHPVLVASQQESNDVVGYRHSEEASCSSAADEDKSNLLADCLLTAVKVLMNLTNDNPDGCRQIATCGGLEILSSLIAGHFSSFRTCLPHSDDARDSSSSSKSSPKSSTPLTDRELDFLVALLGLLVNLVEKDSRNRSRLAAATVSLPNPEGSASKDQSDIISLLCSIFLANQSNTDATGEETYLSWEDEESILQGEKEAEKMIVEAYAALLLAFLSTESQNVRNAISDCLPNHNLRALVPVLERFLEFHMTLNMISPETHSVVLEVIESCRIP
ncbi:WAPL (Wings apart-like protein regulation ofheterochromatin) protein [Striga asiatica]|uniref:WAPL (Wings apart-like protein regulation ofheterochromatin) protein n=1 Tax=Striga asiatica TaxID=4170 RepID=A0A5A7QS59_STRAF|nr:WAPL (Wings apart-like protein regulation ofheterochromatin) protein [Striga asiatica]